MVIREKYLEKIRSFYHQNDIKVIMGLRRSGKSTLVRQIIKELEKDGIDNDHINVIDFDLYENNIYTNTAKLSTYIESLIKDNQKYYLFFDEIQNVIGWEKVINSFNGSLNVSIFVTGSNCDLLSDEFKDCIGKYVSLNILPFSFKEMCLLKGINEPEAIAKFLDEYLIWGGMPQLIGLNDNNEKRTYIFDVYNSIIVKDIAQRFNVKDISLLNRIINYIFITSSEPFSVNEMAGSFGDYNRKVSLDTIYNYLDYINKTSLVKKVERYDLNSKRIMAGKYKYYLTDFSFSNMISNYDKKSQKGSLENLVYNELIFRGYKVNICNIGKKEVDFIARNDKKTLYFQVYPCLQDEKLRNKLYKSYKVINDNYPKYIISYDADDFSKDGIIHLNIIDFLLSNM